MCMNTSHRPPPTPRFWKDTSPCDGRFGGNLDDVDDGCGDLSGLVAVGATAPVRATVGVRHSPMFAVRLCPRQGRTASPEGTKVAATTFKALPEQFEAEPTAAVIAPMVTTPGCR